MSLGMYNATVPTFVKKLTALAKIVDKAAAHCEAKKIPEKVLLETRLTPDMFTLAQQVGVATQHVHWACALLAGKERPTLPNLEPTFADVKKRIDDALAVANAAKKEDLDGSEQRDVKVVVPVADARVPGRRLPVQLRDPELLFPPDDRLRDPAPSRPAARQVGLPRLGKHGRGGIATAPTPH